MQREQQQVPLDHADCTQTLPLLTAPVPPKPAGHCLAPTEPEAGQNLLISVAYVL